MASTPDVAARLHDVEAELTLIAALRDTATDGAEYERLDEAWLLLASDRQRLLRDCKYGERAAGASARA